jgi:hypothetical protein
MDTVKNFAKATVDGTFESADTEINLVTGGTARLPDVPFNAVVWNATDYPDPSDDPNVEIVRVTDNTAEVLTVDRAQEGTFAADHNEAGKTYKLIAGMTARTISEMVGDVQGSGPALIYDTEATSIRLRYNLVRFIDLAPGGMEIQSTLVYLGDFEAEGNASYAVLDDGNTRLTLNNLDLATTQIQSATVAVGVLAGKLAIRDGGGTIIGYLPIYDSIT